MMKTITAVTAIALATGETKAVDVTKASYAGAIMDWDGTFQMWTNKAKQAGYG